MFASLSTGFDKPFEISDFVVSCSSRSTWLLAGVKELGAGRFPRSQERHFAHPQAQNDRQDSTSH
ncbi:hypothetical protein [Pseudomonas sp. 273]|uniref:hypothetical protein n=1 Tax=Pseudomonas sp. 273 TaxID=75692 RepID=UPI0023D8975B|nr:hypothetical protein [Pseudomonas sp. 273]